MMKSEGDANGTISSTEHLRQAYEKDPEAVINLTVQQLKGEQLAQLIHGVIKNSIEKTLAEGK